MLFTAGYTGWKVVTGYRDHRDALAVFGKNVRYAVSRLESARPPAGES